MTILTSLVASTAVHLAVAAVPPGYHATVLPQLDPGDGDGGNTLIYTSPSAINASGVVVGGAGFHNGFIWSLAEGGRLIQAPGAVETSLSAINASGDVAGNALTASGFRPFLQSAGGAYTPLPTLGQGLGAGAAAMNNAGLIVGSAERSLGGPFGGPSTAVFWRDGQIHEIGHLCGESAAAVAVNNNGVVAGYSNTTTALPLQPFRWTESGGIQVLPQLVNEVPATPADINDHGVIVGRAGLSFFANAAVYWTPDGEIHQLPGIHGTPDIGVLAINNDGLMVGHEQGIDWNPEARLWFEDQVFHLHDLVLDLPEGIQLLQAVDINDRGDIIVLGSTVVDGHIQHVSVLLTPIPSPGALALLAPASALALRRRRPRA